ncbi:hypothetical protein BDZ91DRAFT_739217 [Kalaharituber pfeilii]|nr:hypothetical protein BDZ91DRAFT_739217 [Kalaharituber pfeilii]
MASASSRTELLNCPNEILIDVLSYIPSLALVRLLTVSRKIHTVILQILHRRIYQAINLDDHHLIFECYPPSAKMSTPYLHCAYAGTWRIDAPVPPHPSSLSESAPVSNGQQQADCPTNSHKTGHDITTASNIGSLYTHFIPAQSPTSAPTTPPPSSPASSPCPPSNASFPTADPTSLPSTLVPINLVVAPAQPSTQLTAQSSLVKVGRKWGLFTSVIEVFEQKGIPVLRSWLRAAEQATSKQFGSRADLHIRQLGEVRSEEQDGEMNEEEKRRILWVGESGTAGIKFRVRAKGVRRMDNPILMPADEEPAASYQLYYESLMIRTVHLLVTLERSWEEQMAHRPGGIGGMAMVFGGAIGNGVGGGGGMRMGI